MTQAARPSPLQKFESAPPPTCWMEKPEYLVRFWEDHPDGTDKYFQCHGVALDKLQDSTFVHETQTLSLYFPKYTVNITGPKAFDFYNAFCTNTGTFLKSNGVDILSVKFDPRANTSATDE